MLIDLIINNDLDSCYSILKEEHELSEAEMELYKLIDGLDDELKMRIEENYSKYTSRVIRVAYASGCSDFFKLCLTMKEDTALVLETLCNV